jgi:hypothetical protein
LKEGVIECMDGIAVRGDGKTVARRSQIDCLPGGVRK